MSLRLQLHNAVAHACLLDEHACAAGRFKLLSYKKGELPDWMKEEGFAARLDDWLAPFATLQDDSRVKFLPIAHRLKSLDDQNVPTASSIHELRKYSVEGLLEAGFSPELLANVFGNVVYIESGFKGGAWRTDYDGKSVDYGRRRGPRACCCARKVAESGAAPCAQPLTAFRLLRGATGLSIPPDLRPHQPAGASRGPLHLRVGGLPGIDCQTRTATTSELSAIRLPLLATAVSMEQVASAALMPASA